MDAVSHDRINTWDELQDLQRTGWFLCFVRTGESWNLGQTNLPIHRLIGFLGEMRRLCVALSRSSHLLFIVAHRQLFTLTPAMRSLAKWLRETGKVFTVEPDRLLRALEDGRTPLRFALGPACASVFLTVAVRKVLAWLDRPVLALRFVAQLNVDALWKAVLNLDARQ